MPRVQNKCSLKYQMTFLKHLQLLYVAIMAKVLSYKLYES